MYLPAELNTEYTENDFGNVSEDIHYFENKHEIVSKMAYLCGVEEHIFCSEKNSLKKVVYDALQTLPPARIIRCLCRLRNATENRYKDINHAMRNECKRVFALPDLIPQEELAFLEENRISFSGIRQVDDFLYEINRNISDRINNCKDIFPVWLNWDYLRELFIMPQGTKKQGTVEAAKLYYEKKSYYPYGVYINWDPVEIGNLFAHDYKFVSHLYGFHHDSFHDISNLSDVSAAVKKTIYDYIGNAEKIFFVVDCENADPYSMCAMFNGLDDSQVDKISKVILYDDPQAPSGWRFFEQHINIAPEKIEHIVIRRLLTQKSLLDVKLSARVTMEYYKNGVDSFVLASSDSDFWGLMEELPEAKFMVMVEHRKTSPELRKILAENAIFYCYIDNFYTGMDDTLQKQAMYAEFAAFFEKHSFNARALLDEVMITTRVTMSESEKKQFYDRHLKNLILTVDKDGKVMMELKK